MEKLSCWDQSLIWNREIKELSGIVIKRTYDGEGREGIILKGK